MGGRQGRDEVPPGAKINGYFFCLLPEYEPAVCAVLDTTDAILRGRALARFFPKGERMEGVRCEEG